MGQTGPEVLYISIPINFPKTKIELIINTTHREEIQRLKNQNVIKTEEYSDALERWALLIPESNASKFCK